MPSLQVEVLDDEIIVTQSGSKFRAIYHSVHHKPGEQPQLIVKARRVAITISWLKHGSPQTTKLASWDGLSKATDEGRRA